MSAGTRTVRIKPNAVFEWKRGDSLRAHHRSIIILPASLIGEDERIGSVLEFSNEQTLVEFQYPAGGGSAERIRIDLHPGESLRIMKDTEAMVAANTQTPVEFDRIVNELGH